jgi:hypothetical protein
MYLSCTHGVTRAAGSTTGKPSGEGSGVADSGVGDARRAFMQHSVPLSLRQPPQKSK